MYPAPTPTADPASPGAPHEATAPRTSLDALVIGAGQAGLAVGYHLARHGVRFLLVDAAPELGHTWSSRWDSLRLFTPAEYDALPGMAFPAAPGTYPGKDDVAVYLKAYAERFDLPVMLNTRVQHVDQPSDQPSGRESSNPGGLFRVTTSQGTLWARQVVVATGPFQHPHIPDVSAGFAPVVSQRHSSAYGRPTDLPGGKVLVVGAGNSGLQIALELARSREVHVAVGTRPRAVSQRPLGRDLFWWLTKSGAVTRPASSPVATWFRRRGGDLVIGTTWDDIDAAGVGVHPRLTSATGEAAEFADGTRLEDVAAVVWATGFRSDYSWLDVSDVWDAQGVHHTRGRTATAGLWFIGLPWQHTRGSALLGFVGDDAAWVASGVADRQSARPALV